MVTLTIQQAIDLAVQHHRAGRLDEAESIYRQLLQQNPNFPHLLYLLGTVLFQRNNFDRAAAIMQQAIALDPHPLYFNNLGMIQSARGQLDESVAAFQQAITRAPRLIEQYKAATTRSADQAARYRHPIQVLQDHWPSFLYNFGNALKEQGRLDEALDYFRKAIAAAPNLSEPFSNLVYSMLFHPTHDSHAVYRELQAWNRHCAAPLTQLIQPHDNHRDPNRRLRIGYVSTGFRNHCQAFFLTPLLSHHDHQQFEIFYYSDVIAPDHITQQFQTYPGTWRNIVGMTDEQLAEQVRADRIDILVDTIMHMQGCRLLAFARKPAPVQMTWLAYPSSTGLETIDYRITDPYLDPPDGDDSCYSETSIRLPDSFWCYDPLTNEPAVNELPALKNGHITFGCLNSFTKVNEAVLQLWASVLKSVPASRMLILADHGSHRQRVIESLQRSDVDGKRIEFIHRQLRPQYLAEYHRIDLGLDTFPANGHTTSLDAMWMGVPTITLVGNTPVGRGGWSQLNNMKMTELATDSPDRYVQIATELANDLPRLSNLRATLRERLKNSVLMDGPRFASHMETAYRDAWRTWCAG